MALSAPKKDAAGKRLPLNDWVIRELAAMIQRRELQPGDRLVEAALAEKLKVSRGPIREALRQLSANGVVTIEPMKGATVARPDADSTLEMMEVSAVLFGLAARRACRYRTDEDLTALLAISDELIAASRLDETTTNDHLKTSGRLFSRIVYAAHSDQLSNLLRNLVFLGPFGLYASLSMESKAARMEGAECYHAIVEAIRDQNEPEAEAANFRLHRRALKVQGIDLAL
ncbi:MAG: GntR family transcriptional regulator [Alphaproteobacteria bacterium]